MQCAEPLPLQDVIGMAVEMLEGLAQLHGAYILHLDLKPGNVLLDQYHHAYLSDFGISHALTTLEACTSTTGLSGTPHYMYALHALTCAACMLSLWQFCQSEQLLCHFKHVGRQSRQTVTLVPEEHTQTYGALQLVYYIWPQGSCPMQTYLSFRS